MSGDDRGCQTLLLAVTVLLLRILLLFLLSGNKLSQPRGLVNRDWDNWGSTV